MTTFRLPGHIGQVSMPVADVERSTTFYRDLLGLRHLYTYGDLAFFDCAGTRLFLTASPEAPRPPSASSLYFEVDRVQEAFESMSAAGVAFEAGPHRIHTHPDGTEEWMAFFRDPDGNLLALMSRVAPGDG